MLIEALSHNEARLWYVSPSYRQSKQISWALLKGLLRDQPVEVKYNESELSATFPQTNSLIELKGADNEDSLRGTGLGTKHHKGGLALVVDEFASIYDNWEVWSAVLRPMLSDHNAGCLFISTPQGKDAFWELFMKGQRGEKNWASWQFKSISNPFIDDDEIAEAKANLPGRYFRQEYEASFEDYVGLVYPEFSKQHVIKPFYIQTVYERIAAIDPAISGTTASLKAFVDEDGDLVVCEEYYEKNKRVSEVANRIRPQTQEEISWVIDPASQAKNTTKEGQLYSLYDEYRENGIVAYPAENDVEAGINRVGEYFKSNRIKIFSTCTNLIWELERYHWAEVRETNKGTPKPVPYKKDDHLVDCLRYLIMTRKSKADLSDPQLMHPNSPWARSLRLKKEMEYKH